MRVLIVDDDPVFRNPLRVTLAVKGFEVQTADSAEAAERVLAHDAVDVVLSDIGLPGMDGLTLAGRYPDIPFVLMTGSPPPESSAPRPAPARLVKPFEPSDVVALLHEAVRRHRCSTPAGER
jgi:DNA-binding response OmpR family regulator